MKLFKTSIKFQTLKILKQFVELSKEKRKLYRGGYVDKGMCEYMKVSFNFGRQGGHTSAIIDYMKSKPADEILVIVHNEDMKRFYTKELKDSNKSQYVVNINDSHIHYISSNKTLIFDCASYMNIDGWLSNHFVYLNPSAVVCVG